MDAAPTCVSESLSSTSCIREHESPHLDALPSWRIVSTTGVMERGMGCDCSIMSDNKHVISKGGLCVSSPSKLTFCSDRVRGIELLEEDDPIAGLPVEVVPAVILAVLQIHRGPDVLTPDVVYLDQVGIRHRAAVAHCQRPVFDGVAEGLPHAVVRPADAS